MNYFTVSKLFDFGLQDFHKHCLGEHLSLKITLNIEGFHKNNNVKHQSIMQWH